MGARDHGLELVFTKPAIPAAAAFNVQGLVEKLNRAIDYRTAHTTLGIGPIFGLSLDERRGVSVSSFSQAKNYFAGRHVHARATQDIRLEWEMGFVHPFAHTFATLYFEEGVYDEKEEEPTPYESLAMRIHHGLDLASGKHVSPGRIQLTCESHAEADPSRTDTAYTWLVIPKRSDFRAVLPTNWFMRKA